MLLSLHLANIRTLSCSFFLFLVFYNNLFIIHVAKQNTITNTSLVIPTGAPATVAWEMIETPPALVFKTFKILSM